MSRKIRGRVLIPDLINASGGKDYTLVEQDSGVKWVDGSTVYQKTINLGSLPNNTSKSVPHGVTGISRLIKADGMMYRTSTFTLATLPNVHDQTIGNQVQYSLDATNVTVRTGSDKSAFSGYLTIFYTKS